jgi:glycosyltransferase involved in cell wall biosynthesis
MREPPKVSVCLLTYKRADVLSRSIESILAQDFKDFELILNDDCSPDNTAEVCAAYVRKDSRVKYFRNDHNLRYSGNQNAAMDRANGEFIAYVHDGDVYYPFMLSEWVRALTENPSAGIVFNAVNVREEHGIPASTHTHEYGPLIVGKDLFEEMISSSSSPIFGIVMLRTAALRATGKFDTALPVLADVDMWLRLLLTYDAAYIRKPLYEVMPREVGHVNRTPIVNWKIQAERDRIFVLNLARYYGGWDRVPPSERQRLQRRRFLENGRALAGCFVRGSFAKFAEGTRAIYGGRPFGITVNLRSELDEPALRIFAESAGRS